MENKKNHILLNNNEWMRKFINLTEQFKKTNMLMNNMNIGKEREILVWIRLYFIYENRDHHNHC